MRLIKRALRAAVAALPLVALATPALAEDTLSAGDTAWMITATALVLMMTLPGLALFYGGLVRSKNVLSVLMQCMVTAGMASIVWVLVGYSLAFSGDGDYIGNLDKAFLDGITYETLSGTIPEYVFIAFQGMFAVITPALMLGAFAERIRFGPYLAFVTIWLLVVYSPLAHMVWGGGMIGGDGWGAVDFAGGLVVHMSSGWSALVAAIFVGPRMGYGKESIHPHNLVLTVIGASLLWVGWFGFNAGSQLAADGVAGLAFLNTNTATAAAVVTWCIIEWLHLGKPTVLGAATAAVAGLVGITPACANVSPVGAIGVGVTVAIACYAAVAILKPRMGYDDSLDVFGVHGVGGMWGALATAIFISENTDAGYGGQIWIQLQSIGFTALFSVGATIAILFVLRAVFGDLRVSEDDEAQGLDLAEHSESAYD